MHRKGTSMDFKFSEEDEAFRRDFRSWLEKNLPRDWHDEGELHDPDTKEEFERRRGWHRKLYDGGWMCIHWPKEYGGRGATLLAADRLCAGTRPRQGAADDQLPGHRARRPDPDAVGHAGTEEALHPQNSVRRGNLVPGLVGAQSRLRPRRGRDPRGRRGRSLRRQRLEGLDLQRASRRLQHPAVPHRSRRCPSTRASAICWST